MAIPLKLGNTTKRVNSTFQPDSTLWNNYDVILKQDTSIEQPVFLLQVSAATLSGYNYAVGAGILQGFYWIVDIVSVAANRSEVYCVRDVLANNKTAIMGTNAYIEYGFNTFDAGDSTYRVSDTRQSISKTPTQTTATVDISGGKISSAGTYILQAIASNRGVVTYAMNRTNLTKIIQKINSDIDTDVLTIETSGASPDQQLASLAGLDLRHSLLQETAVNAIQTCFWLPLSTVGADIDGPTHAWLGNWESDADVAYFRDSPLITNTATLNIPWPVNDWRRCNCQLVLYLPFIGTVPIPIDQCVNYSSLTIKFSAEFFSGDVSVTVYAGNYAVYTGTTNISAPVAVGQNIIGASKAVGGAIQAIGGGLQMAGGLIDATAGAMGIATSTASAGFLSGAGSLTGGINTMVSGAGNMFSGYAQTVQPAITCSGTMGGLAGMGQETDARLTVMYFPPIDDAGFSAVYGHPVMKIATPVAGFCKTKGFSLASADRINDVSTVNNAMDGGVFIE